MGLKFVNKQNMWYFVILGVIVICSSIFWLVYKDTQEKQHAKASTNASASTSTNVVEALRLEPIMKTYNWQTYTIEPEGSGTHMKVRHHKKDTIVGYKIVK